MAYRRVESRIWNDEKFRDLSDDGKLVFLMLLTHPHMTSVGAMRATVEGLAAEMKWSVERFRNGFGTVSKAYMAEFDEKAGLVALPNFLKHNPPANPNVVKGWVYALELLPECQLKRDVMNRCRNRIETNAAWVREGLAKPFANTEQEQEQEQEQDLLANARSPQFPQDKAGKTEASTTTTRGTRLARALDVDDTLDALYASLPAAWASWCEAKRPDLRAAAVWVAFCNHWKAAPGSKGVKADWEATWRNWVAKEPQGRPGAARGAQEALEARNRATAERWQPPAETEVTP